VPDPYRIGLGNRGTISFAVANVAAGVDELVHGSANLHGWGQWNYPDPNLLVVRGFDATSKAFIYSANPAFGSARAFRNAYPVPFSLRIDFRVELGPDRETQFIKSALRTSKSDETFVQDAGAIKQRLNRAVFNPYEQLLRFRDTLKLNRVQIDSLQRMGERYMRRRDSIANVLATFLASRNGALDGEDVRQVWHSSIVAAERASIENGPQVRALLAPQLQAPSTATLLAPVMQFFLADERTLEIISRGPVAGFP
jgi:hypothetical protein